MLGRALGRARGSIFWERLWPALASIATVIGLFLAVSWLGLWLWLPPIGRAVGLGVFFLLMAAAFAPLFLIRLPSRFDGLKRLDRNSACRIGRRPRSLTRSRPRPGLVLDRAVACHTERGAARGEDAQAGIAGAARLALRDPFALRALVAVLVVATLVAAGGKRLKRRRSIGGA